MNPPTSQASVSYPVLWQLVGVILLATIILGSLLPISIGQPTNTLPHLDKIVHFSAWGLLSGWYLAVIPRRRNNWLIPLFLFALSLWIEWLQGITGYREASLADGVANLAGITFGSLVIAAPLRGILSSLENSLIALKPFGRRSRTTPPLYRRGLWQLIGLHLLIALLISAFTPIELASIPIPHIDKILHFTVYGAVTAWLLVVFPSSMARIAIPLGMLILSCSTELMQGFTTSGGEPSVFDALADTAGILAAGLLTYAPVGKLLRIIEKYTMPAPKRRRRRRRTDQPRTSSSSVR